MPVFLTDVVIGETIVFKVVDWSTVYAGGIRTLSYQPVFSARASVELARWTNWPTAVYLQGVVTGYPVWSDGNATSPSPIAHTLAWRGAPDHLAGYTVRVVSPLCGVLHGSVGPRNYNVFRLLGGSVGMSLDVPRAWVSVRSGTAKALRNGGCLANDTWPGYGPLTTAVYVKACEYASSAVAVGTFVVYHGTVCVVTASASSYTLAEAVRVSSAPVSALVPTIYAGVALSDLIVLSFGVCTPTYSVGQKIQWAGTATRYVYGTVQAVLRTFEPGTAMNTALSESQDLDRLERLKSNPNYAALDLRLYRACTGTGKTCSTGVQYIIRDLESVPSPTVLTTAIAIASTAITGLAPASAVVAPAPSVYMTAATKGGVQLNSCVIYRGRVWGVRTINADGTYELSEVFGRQSLPSTYAPPDNWKKWASAVPFNKCILLAASNGWLIPERGANPPLEGRQIAWQDTATAPSCFNGAIQDMDHVFDITTGDGALLTTHILRIDADLTADAAKGLTSTFNFDKRLRDAVAGATAVVSLTYTISAIDTSTSPSTTRNIRGVAHNTLLFSLQPATLKVGSTISLAGVDAVVQSVRLVRDQNWNRTVGGVPLGYGTIHGFYKETKSLASAMDQQISAEAVRSRKTYKVGALAGLAGRVVTTWDARVQYVVSWGGGLDLPRLVDDESELVVYSNGTSPHGITAEVLLPFTRHISGERDADVFSSWFDNSGSYDLSETYYWLYEEGDYGTSGKVVASKRGVKKW